MRRLAISFLIVGVASAALGMATVPPSKEFTEFMGHLMVGAGFFSLLTGMALAIVSSIWRDKE